MDNIMEDTLEVSMVLGDLPPRASKTFRFKVLMDENPGSWVVLATERLRAGNAGVVSWVKRDRSAYEFAERTNPNGDRFLLGRKVV